MSTLLLMHAVDHLDDAGCDARFAHFAGIAVLVTGVVAVALAMAAGLWLRALLLVGATAPAILVAMLAVDAAVRRRD